MDTVRRRRETSTMANALLLAPGVEIQLHGRVETRTWRRPP
jgi:hypothetical protein